MAERVVIHPVEGNSIPRAFRAIDGIDVVTPADADAVAEALVGAEILVSWAWRDDFLTPSLRWIQSVSIGVEQFPADALRDAGIVLTNPWGISGVQVSEHAFALLLSMTRGVARGIRYQAEHRWKPGGVIELEGKTLAVLGLGSIGEAIAGKGRTFGMHVIGVKRTLGGYDGAAHEVTDSILDACTRADVVIVALPGGPETRGAVGAQELDALGAGFLVNVGRGAVVDTDALVGALTDGPLRGAGLDVFDVEPLSAESPLWDLPNVVITPHQAGHSPRYGDQLAEVFLENLAAYRGAGEWRNRII